MKHIRLVLNIMLLVCIANMQAQGMTVAERNAVQGFNDTIDRLAPDFVTVFKQFLSCRK